MECRELFYVSERNKRKVFCSALCRERYHSHAKYQQFKAWRECVYEKQASYQKQVSCKGEGRI